MPTWLPVIVTIGIFVIGIYNGALAYFLRKHMDRVDQLERQQRDDREKSAADNHTLRKELEDLKQLLPLQYVLREDFIRWSMAVERKIDHVIELVTELRIMRSQKQGGDADGNGP